MSLNASSRFMLPTKLFYGALISFNFGSSRPPPFPGLWLSEREIRKTEGSWVTLWSFKRRIFNAIEGQLLELNDRIDQYTCDMTTRNINRIAIKNSVTRCCNEK